MFSCQQSICKRFAIFQKLPFLFCELCKTIWQSIHISTIQHPRVIEEVLVSTIARLCKVQHEWFLNHCFKMSKMTSCGLLSDPDTLNDIDVEVCKAVLFTKTVPCAKTSILLSKYKCIGMTQTCYTVSLELVSTRIE